MAAAEPKLGLALSGGGHRAAFFHIGVLARLAELGLLRPIRVISTVSGGSIVGALYYLHVKNLLESKRDDEMTDADYIQLVRNVEEEYREAAATNVRGSGWANLRKNFKMAKPTYSRTDRVGELYEERFYRKAWGERTRQDGRIAMRDLLIHPKGHEGSFNPERDNPSRNAPVPILLLEATTLNTGHNWRFEAMYMGEPPRQGTADEAMREDIDKNVVLQRTAWSELPPACRNFPLGGAVASSACFPGGFAPMQVPGLFEDLVVELVDGGVHDNQGIEGLVDHGCTHYVISDGSGQMPDSARPSTRLPAVLGRVVSIYGDAEREQRLQAAMQGGDTVAFMHLQTGLPARTRTPSGEVAKQAPKLASTEFGVAEEVQHALAQIRTDLDAFSDLEAWSLMADGHKLASTIIPKRAGVAGLGTPVGASGWAFDAVAPQLADPQPDYLKVLRVGKQQFLKPARMTPGALPAVMATIGLAAAAAAAGLWLLLTPHGTALFIAALAAAAVLGIYFASDNQYVKPVAIAVFDVIMPALLAIPMLGVAALQLAAGRRWRSLGSARRLQSAREGEHPRRPV
jgi:NTE family protein